MSALQLMTRRSDAPRPTDRGPERQVLLAPRPGWRGSASLSAGVSLADGVLQLADLAPRSVFDCPPQRVIDLPDCQRGVIDIAGNRVLIVTGTGQVRRIIGPLPGWQPIGLVLCPPERLAVLDTARVVHLFDCHGTLVEAVDDLPGCPWPEGAARYPAAGTHITLALDSGTPGCRWHAVRLAGSVPAGTAVDVDVLTTDLDLTEAQVAVQGVADPERWTPVGAFGDPALAEWDALVRSAPGQYLWLRLTLHGDGTQTPVLRAASVSWVRHTSLERLPAAFAAGESDHLERYLAITDAVRDSVVARLDGFARQLDPRSAEADPDHDFLAWLGRWLGLDDMRTLPVERRRRLVAAAADLFRRRGTPDGVARHVGLWLGRRTVPLEHFRLRRWAVAGQGRVDDVELFGDDVVRRLHLGEFSRIGEFRLVEVPSPRTDPFRVFAHLATLFVHAKDGDDLDALAATAARVAGAVAPAHCAVHIVVVTATARLGVQARLGMDAVVSGPLRPGHLDDRLDLALAPDPARSGIAAIGIDAHVGSALG